MKHRQTDATGKSSNKLIPRARRNLKPDGPFVAHTREMLESTAWRSLGINARRVLDRIEVEHLAHAGTENGSLPVTHADFIAAGVSRNQVTKAIREAHEAGFIDYRRGGRYGGEKRPSMFRLTYLGTPDWPPTNEWKRNESDPENSVFCPQIRECLPPKEGVNGQISDNAETPESQKTANLGPDGLPPLLGDLSISTRGVGDRFRSHSIRDLSPSRPGNYAGTEIIHCVIEKKGGWRISEVERGRFQDQSNKADQILADCGFRKGAA